MVLAQPIEPHWLGQTWVLIESVHFQLNHFLKWYQNEPEGQFINLYIEIHLMGKSIEKIKIQLYSQAASYTQEISVSLRNDLERFLTKPELFVLTGNTLIWKLAYLNFW